MNKEDYQWFKEHHICTHCRKEKAETGKTLCLSCLIENRKYKKKNVDKCLESQKSKEKRQQRKELGLCVNCGVRPQIHGLLCTKCYSTRKVRNERNRSTILRSERRSHNLCYICGSPAIQNKGVCSKCYQTRIVAMSSCMYMTKDEKNTVWSKLSL